ncbi:MAG TPA: sensor histidine kinase [Longimicrobiaceae bacterium]|nr:sensor histidine kinase [Longimicrobiaceae bacterium]
MHAVSAPPPSSAPQPPDRHELRIGALWKPILGFWALYWAAYAAIQTVAWGLDPGSYYTLPTAARLLEEFCEAALWALLTPLIFWLSGRFPIGRGSWHRNGPLHVGAALLITGVYEYLTFHVHNLLAHPPAERHPSNLAAMAAHVLDVQYRLQLFFYLAILTAGWALHTYRDLQRQQLAAARLQAQLSEARLQALRMQLHPHFLFNTLNTISNLTQRDPRDARRVIARLGELLRRALESTEQEIPLGEELRFAQGYLDIVRARFGERLRIELQVAPSLEDALVPTLILQPVLENAVEHGVAASLADGWIGVEVEREGEVLRLRVSDNGPGFRGREVVEGVGIRNTRARLEQLYGQAGRLTLRDTDGGGATVELVLPYRVSTHARPEPAPEPLAVGGGE